MNPDSRSESADAHADGHEAKAPQGPGQRNHKGSKGAKRSGDANRLNSHEDNRKPKKDRSGFRKGSKRFSPQPEWLPKVFRRDADGAIFFKDEDYHWKPVCSEIVADALTRTAEGDGWGLLVRVRDRDGNWHEWAMPMAELAGSGEAYRARLLDMGLEIAPGLQARSELHRLLTLARPWPRRVVWQRSAGMEINTCDPMR
jgi:hypothetical protein